MALQVTAHGIPWQPVAQKKKKTVLNASVVTKFHAVIWWMPRGSPWYSRIVRGIPRDSPWHPMASYAAVHDILRSSPWHPMLSHVTALGIPWQPVAKKKTVLKASVVTNFHVVIWWLVMILDDLVHIAHGTPWHPMASYGIPWHPMASRGNPWHPT